MNLYRLGAIPWDETQAIYHVLAETQQEGLVICRPAGRCVCLGLHDDLQQEVNTKYCRGNKIPIIRRDIGGGMVLLAEEQIFFQLVLRAGNPLLTGQREAFFGQFLQPAIKTLADFTINASIKLPADIVVNGKKISGNGAGDINGFSVYTGNILLAFDRAAMANVLNVPSNRFREQIRLSMERYLTTMDEELGYMPDYESVEERLVYHFATWLDPKPREYTQELKTAVNKMARYLTSSEFLSLPGKRTKVRQVKINEGTYVRLHPFPQCLKSTVAGQSDCGNRLGGPCSGYAILVVQNNKIANFESHGLTCLEGYNLNSLAACLIGSSWHENDIRIVLTQWLQNHQSSAVKVFKNALLDWILAR
ncbi:lipoate--protein ligase family protein [Sporomusa malonica]|uniref:Lipoate-protein ligase A n=1 Tax=Sporomusa malonica TaxID=112901 RepID=A0A1W2EQX4_9FIRM|nr:biotin/lipoate A/B protein ligase family protein [Sporomusa malonica]SMD12109.1 lipoate-protein ligase A [Sporomusa malonica]